jgi:ubiquinone/menaquinone biosynthesis C-methylase UbiE
MKPVNKASRLYPVEQANSLDRFLRRAFQNPRKILKPYIRPGMTILDLGCGPGFFTIDIAEMLNGSGKVIAADLQEGMLERVKTKIKGTRLENIIELHRCETDTIGVTTPVDFVLAFYMVHEVKNHLRLFEELKSILHPEGIIFIVEPIFHVSDTVFEKMVSNLIKSGFEVIARPKVFLSRAVLLNETGMIID